MAEETKKTQKPKEKMYSETDVKKLIAEAIKEEMSKQQPTQTYTIRDEYVTLLYIGAICQGTSVNLGNIGRINRSGGTLDVPKRDFIQNLGNRVVDSLLRSRSLIVVNGLTDEERERYGLLYREGELLSQTMYFKLFDYPQADILRIYKDLCDEHKKVVAKMYMTAYFDKKDNRINIDLIKKLNKISKTVYANGLFAPILDDMSKKIVEDEEE